MESQLEGQRGALAYGQQFFSRSPFRSIPFLIATLALTGDMLYGSYLVCHYWNVLSTSRVSDIVISEGLLVVVYRSALYRFGLLRADMPAESSAESGVDGPRLDTALTVAAATVEWLTYLYLIVAMLLLCIGALLKHVGP